MHGASQPWETRLIPKKFQAGDQLRVLALSRSIGGVLKSSPLTEADVEFAQRRLESLGLRVTFGEHTRECDEHLTAPIEARLDDLRQALNDVSPKRDNGRHRRHWRGPTP